MVLSMSSEGIIGVWYNKGSVTVGNNYNYVGCGQPRESLDTTKDTDGVEVDVGR